MLRTNSMSCSTTTTVCSPARLLQQLGRALHLRRGSCPRPARRPAAPSGPAPAASRSPATASGRATAGPPRASRWSGRPMSSSTSSMRSALGGAAAARTACATRPCCPCSASSQFSNTVCPWNTVGRWNFRPMPSSAISALGQLGQIDVAPVSRKTPPVVGPGLAGDDVHQRGLARAVGADDAAELALLQHSVDVGQRLEAVEADRQVLDPERPAAAAPRRASGSRDDRRRVVFVGSSWGHVRRVGARPARASTATAGASAGCRRAFAGAAGAGAARSAGNERRPGRAAGTASPPRTARRAT